MASEGAGVAPPAAGPAVGCLYRSAERLLERLRLLSRRFSSSSLFLEGLPLELS